MDEREPKVNTEERMADRPPREPRDASLGDESALPVDDLGNDSANLPPIDDV